MVLRGLYSFPTRRSSDLQPRVDDLQVPAVVWLVNDQHVDQPYQAPGDECHQLGEDLAGQALLLELEHQHLHGPEDRKSTRLNSSHVAISYAGFCVKKERERGQPGLEVSNVTRLDERRERGGAAAGRAHGRPATLARQQLELRIQLCLRIVLDPGRR